MRIFLHVDKILAINYLPLTTPFKFYFINEYNNNNNDRTCNRSFNNIIVKCRGWKEREREMQNTTYILSSYDDIKELINVKKISNVVQ